jgi:hypothetical protein
VVNTSMTFHEGVIPAERAQTNTGGESSSNAFAARSEPATDIAGGNLLLKESRLTQSLQRTDMTIGMHSDEFGTISIHTLMAKNQISAVISVNHSELGHALESHLLSAPVVSHEERPMDVKVQYMSASSGSFAQGTDSQGSSEDRGKGHYTKATPQTSVPATLPKAPGGVDGNVASIELRDSRLDVRV